MMVVAVQRLVGSRAHSGRNATRVSKMGKRSPYESYHRRQRQIDSAVLKIMLSAICLCEHPQGFHHNTDDGANLGKCVDADCPCEAFDEDVLYEARLRAELAQGTSAKRDEAADDDALARAMREHERREIAADRTWEQSWDHALEARRPNHTGKPRRETLDDPAAMEALRQIGGNPEDLTGS